ncbi:rhodoquinone biosynthesis methyltransferase RquA [soil metagenome]
MNPPFNPQASIRLAAEPVLAQVLPIPAAASQPPLVPQYLHTHYWWAYVHPRAVKIFERQWLVNLILWGNYTRLCNAVLQSYGPRLAGRTLQIACAYGDLTPRLAQRIDADGMLDVIDILPIQLDNLAHKLPPDARVTLHCMDSSALAFADQSFDQALLYFLLHEQPLAVRKKTLAEALRVIRPGGTLTIVDYARPSRFNPLRYLWAPILARLEPFAADLWREEVANWLPAEVRITHSEQRRFFGGLYQMLTLTTG